MRKFLCLFVLLPFLAFSQGKNVITVNRVFPKVDKVLEFEKAIAAHAQKYHTGDWKWRIFEIQSGPDAGGYHITEGPNTWDELDTRGNLGTEHNNDWNKNVAIYLTDRSSISYSVFQDSLSTIALTDYADKIAITHLFPQVGWGNKVRSMIENMRKAWIAGNESIAVYMASSSGPAQFSIVSRYKQGLKERAPGFRKPFMERYEAANGTASSAEYLQVLRDHVRDSWSELLFYRSDLSSK
jgi:hypothetical protein